MPGIYDMPSISILATHYFEGKMGKETLPVRRYKPLANTMLSTLCTTFSSTPLTAYYYLGEEA